MESNTRREEGLRRFFRLNIRIGDFFKSGPIAKSFGQRTKINVALSLRDEETASLHTVIEIESAISNLLTSEQRIGGWQELSSGIAQKSRFPCRETLRGLRKVQKAQERNQVFEKVYGIKGKKEGKY